MNCYLIGYYTYKIVHYYITYCNMIVMIYDVSNASHLQIDDAIETEMLPISYERTTKHKS